MSHFSQIKTQIQLILSRPAKPSQNWALTGNLVPGCEAIFGQTRNAGITIEQDSSYDVGFSWNGNEYRLVA